MPSKTLQQNLKSNEIILHLDFSKNYKNQQQHSVILLSHCSQHVATLDKWMAVLLKSR